MRLDSRDQQGRESDGDESKKKDEKVYDENRMTKKEGYYSLRHLVLVVARD